MAVRSDLPALPQRMLGRPVDPRGYPVPWFVAMMADGKWDFRVIRPGGVRTAIQRNSCWLCGESLGVHKTFVIGPMCVINRTTSEPPSHFDCAEWAVRSCPFMLNPTAKRSGRDLPSDAQAPAGIHLDRNPGAMCLYTSRTFTPFKVGNHLPASDGMLINIGPPSSVYWYARGRKATREEVLASIDTGVPHLRKIAEDEGPDAVRELDRYLADALALLPEAA